MFLQHFIRLRTITMHFFFETCESPHDFFPRFWSPEDVDTRVAPKNPHAGNLGVCAICVWAVDLGGPPEWLAFEGMPTRNPGINSPVEGKGMLKSQYLQGELHISGWLALGFPNHQRQTAPHKKIFTAPKQRKRFLHNGVSRIKQAWKPLAWNPKAKHFQLDDEPNLYIGVSKNSGIPKLMAFSGKPY